LLLEDTAKKTIPLTRIQRLIGDRMLKSKLTKPCFYIKAKADMTELMGLRRKLGKSLGVKITSNTFLIRVLALAAREFPAMLGRLADDKLVIADAINVGFAVNSSQGLVVPVIRNANKKSLAEIAELDILLTDKARHNKLTLTDLEGETIALSNLGAFGIDSFIGIAPPPTSAILSAGNVVRTIVPYQGRPQMRKIAELWLAVDHRAIDGAYAARFLSFIAEQLQNPQRLV
jgi:pyruvate dehydrogenase E2 component (dihydrolipoamide acetyltransferase)